MEANQITQSRSDPGAVAEIGVEPSRPQGREERAFPRYQVDGDAELLFVEHGLPEPCRVLDLSWEGCCLSMRDRIFVGKHIHIEVTFRIHGIAFRFSGETRWSDGSHKVGIHFNAVPERRKHDLSEVLKEMAELDAVKASKTAAARKAENGAGSSETGADGIEIEDDSESPPDSCEPTNRQSQPRYALHEMATIYFIKGGFRLDGHLEVLSMAGCRIHTADPLPVGIYTRIEALFYAHGLPFRLAGMIETLHDPCTVGIRFIEISQQGAACVEELIDEIRTAQEARVTSNRSEFPPASTTIP